MIKPLGGPCREAGSAHQPGPGNASILTQIHLLLSIWTILVPAAVVGEESVGESPHGTPYGDHESSIDGETVQVPRRWADTGVR
jgi:hypothetical protein